MPINPVDSLPGHFPFGSILHVPQSQSVDRIRRHRETWTTKKGEILLIKDMTDKHLKNAINLLKNQASHILQMLKHNYLYMAEFGEMGEYEYLITYTKYKYLRDEVKRRRTIR